jgi:hypothetical protein
MHPVVDAARYKTSFPAAAGSMDTQISHAVRVFSMNPAMSFFCVVGFFYRLTNANFASLFSLNRHSYGAPFLSNTIKIIQTITGLELELIDYQIHSSEMYK